jgi:1-acyl-sn-glycerol-3-phosphate acyltransferase
MLDLARLRSIRLHTKPFWQRAIAQGFLRFDYRHVDLVIEGLETLPKTPVIYAMNHTDNFNYWPLQYTLHQRFARYTATWVKGKNYEHPLVAAFMASTNNIPIASRGYLVTRDFVRTMRRRPTEAEYRALRDAVDGGRAVDASTVPAEFLTRARDMFGRRFEPSRERYDEALDAVFGELMGCFVELNRKALAMDLDVLVFPEGSRSVRLSHGHIGIAQVALHLGATIVPVGCSGSDRVYPGGSPSAKPGRIVYRFGRPMTPDVFADLAPPRAFTPFGRADEALYASAFQAVTDRVMDAIDPLLDPEYRYAVGHDGTGTEGTHRFL